MREQRGLVGGDDEPVWSESLQDRWSHSALIAVFLLLQGVTAAAAPWVPDVLLMGAVSGFSAFFTGAIVTSTKSLVQFRLREFVDRHPVREK